MVGAGEVAGAGAVAEAGAVAGAGAVAEAGAVAGAGAVAVPGVRAGVGAVAVPGVSSSRARHHHQSGGNTLPDNATRGGPKPTRRED